MAEEQRVNDLKAISLKVNYECSIKDNANEYKSYCDDAIRLSSNNKDITIEKAIKDKLKKKQGKGVKVKIEKDW